MTNADVLMPETDFARAELPDLHRVLDELRAVGSVVRVMHHGGPLLPPTFQPPKRYAPYATTPLSSIPPKTSI